MGRVNPWRDKPEDCVEQYHRLKQVGATHVAVGTSEHCFISPGQFFDDLQQFKELLDES